MSSFQVRIDVAKQKLLVGDEEVVTLRRMPLASSVCLLKFGRVYSPTDIDVPANSELTIWVKFDLMSLRIGLGWWKSRKSWLTAHDCWAVLLLPPAGKTNGYRNAFLIFCLIRYLRKGLSLADCIEASVVAEAVNGLEDADADADGHVSVTSGVTIGTGLSAVDKQRVATLLDKYRDVFASPGNTGCCNILYLSRLNNPLPVGLVDFLSDGN